MFGNTHVSWAYSWEGRIFRVNGKKVIVDTQLTEYEDTRLAQRHIFALGRMKPNNQEDEEIPITLKIRYDLDPKPFDIEDLGHLREISYEHVLFELELIRILANAGHGPRLLGNCYGMQNKCRPYPGRLIYYTMMERVPGEDVDEIRDDLSPRQLRSIKKQLAEILELMRTHNRCMDTEDPTCLRYDAEKDKLYLVDLTHWGVMQSFDSPPITEDDDFVLAFGLWDKQNSQPQLTAVHMQSLQSAGLVAPRPNASPSRGSVPSSRENRPPTQQTQEPKDMED